MPDQSLGGFGGRSLDRAQVRERREVLRVIKQAVFGGWKIPPEVRGTIPAQLAAIMSDGTASARDRIRACETLVRMVQQRTDAAVQLERALRADSEPDASPIVLQVFTGVPHPDRA